MDFFADGGFQQLFSDLHAEQQLDFPHTNICDVYAKIAPAYSSGDDSCQMLDIYASECCYGGHSPLQEAFCTYDTYIDEAPLDEEVTQYLCEVLNVRGDTSNASDECNSVRQFTQSDDRQRVESSLELLLPAELDAVEVSFSTTEMPEWEELLGNCIEIPELVDFLPEKTPLCNEMCELFLQESSKNLQLFHKPKSNPFESLQPPEKGYACSFGACQKIYAKPAHLKAHLRRHLGEKPYICTWTNCTWKFSRSDELARHRRSHSGVKPYKCDYCTKCFARSDHLTKHRKVHERRMLAASKAGKAIDGVLPHSVYTVRPGRKRKNQIC